VPPLFAIDMRNNVLEKNAALSHCRDYTSAYISGSSNLLYPSKPRCIVSLSHTSGIR
jgi:hypothetical protein